MMGSSIPGALAYLLAKVPELQAVKASNASVTDGWPAARRDTMVVLGLDPNGNDTGLSWSYTDLSSDEVESVALPAVIVAHRIGDNAAFAARRAAFDIVDDLRTLIRLDRYLGGAVDPHKEPARIVRAAMSPTNRAKQAGQGRVVEVNWWLQWDHRLD